MSGHSCLAWVCCQLGAREHYSIPRALHEKGSLEYVVTDAWIPPAHSLGTFKRNLRERYHQDIPSARVLSFNLGIIVFELLAKAKKLKGWDLILARNHWFQHRVLSLLRNSELTGNQQQRTDNEQPVLFSYSYTALEPFRWAKAIGWTTVLGQIDPGPAEERIVNGLEGGARSVGSKWRPAPAKYWDDWREECRLADHIVVNSEWSRKGLLEEEIAEEKIVVVPLAYEPPPEAAGFQRSYPTQFTGERPLRVLFLGQVNLRKGVIPLLEAIRVLKDEPIEFWFVGPLQVEIPADVANSRRVRWIGAVPRSDVSRYYGEADVFIFPTFSDGFGLTQLEAQAWRLPLIASENCGGVVRDGVNGVLLAEITGDRIAQTLRSLCREPQRLATMSRSSDVSDFTLARLADRLLEIPRTATLRKK